MFICARYCGQMAKHMNLSICTMKSNCSQSKKHTHTQRTQNASSVYIFTLDALCLFCPLLQHLNSQQQQQKAHKKKPNEKKQEPMRSLARVWGEDLYTKPASATCFVPFLFFFFVVVDLLWCCVMHVFEPGECVFV